MRRLPALLLLVALASLILALGGDAAQARAKRKKARRHVPSQATAVTSAPTSTPAPTPPDVIPRRLLVLGFGGTGAQAARTATLAALRKKPSLTVVPLRPSEALRIGTNYSPQKTVGLAKRLNLTAVLYGEVTRERRTTTVTLTLANGEDARVVGEIPFEGRTIGAVRAKIRTQLWAKLSPFIDQAASPGRTEAPEKNVEGLPPESARPAGAQAETPPETETPTPPETPTKPPRTGATGPARRETAPKAEGKPEAKPEGEEPETEPEKAEPGTVEVTPERRAHKAVAPSAAAPPPGEGEAPATNLPRCSLADLEPAGGVMFRRFNYRDEQRGPLRGYTLYRAPVGRIEGTLYPFGGPCSLLAGLGVRLAYEQQGPAKATLANRSLSTSASAYQAEVVLRIVRGRITWQPAVGYFVRHYSVESGVVPTADYRSVGAQLDASYRLRPWSFELGVGGRRPLSVGTLQDSDWFPGVSAFTITGRAQLGLAVNDWIDILLGAYLEYDSLDFHIVDGGPYPNGVASGAFDLYLQGLLSARFRFGLGPARP